MYKLEGQEMNVKKLCRKENIRNHEEDHSGIHLGRIYYLPLIFLSGSTSVDVRWCPSLALDSLSKGSLAASFLLLDQLSLIPAPAGDWTCNPGTWPYWESNWQLLAFWDSAQPAEPHWSGSGQRSLHIQDISPLSHIYIVYIYITLLITLLSTLLIPYPPFYWNIIYITKFRSL